MGSTAVVEKKQRVHEVSLLETRLSANTTWAVLDFLDRRCVIHMTACSKGWLKWRSYESLKRRLWWRRQRYICARPPTNKYYLAGGTCYGVLRYLLGRLAPTEGATPDSLLPVVSDFKRECENELKDQALDNKKVVALTSNSRECAYILDDFAARVRDATERGWIWEF